MPISKQNFNYPPDVKAHLRAVNFDGLPGHIGGFSMDYNLTKRRIEQYYSSLKKQKGEDEAWEQWGSFSTLEKENFLNNIEILKGQQQSLIEELQAVKRPAKDNNKTLIRKVSGKSSGKKHGRSGSAYDAAAAAKKTFHGSVDSIKRGLWTPEEDLAFQKAMAKYGGSRPDYEEISTKVFRGVRSADALRRRWKKIHFHSKGNDESDSENESSDVEDDDGSMSVENATQKMKKTKEENRTETPSSLRAAWTASEDAAFQKALASYDTSYPDWREISTKVFNGSRTPSALKQHWKKKQYRKQQLEQNKRKVKQAPTVRWTQEELDSVAANLEKILQVKPWNDSLMSRLLPKRTQRAITDKARELIRKQDIIIGGSETKKEPEKENKDSYKVEGDHNKDEPVKHVVDEEDDDDDSWNEDEDKRALGWGDSPQEFTL